MKLEREERLKKAIVQIVTIASTLKKHEWSRIVAQINLFYDSKAAKVQFDGDELAHIQKILLKEILS